MAHILRRTGMKKKRLRKKRSAAPTRTLAVRNFDPALYAAVKAQARAERLTVREWIERAVTHQLAWGDHDIQPEARAALESA